MKRHHIGRVSRGRAFLCFLAVAGATLSAAPAFSSQDTTNAPADYPKVLREMVDAGKMQVVKAFPTDKDGMTGYLVKHGGYQTVVYSEDGYLMLGPLYGPQGHNLSSKYAQKYKPKPNVGEVIQSLDAGRMVTEGPKNTPRLYVFADPNCIYCHKLYERTKPLVKAGNLRVHWIMVGVLGPSSVGRAATILAADDPAAALARNEAKFKTAQEQGGVPPSKPNPMQQDVLEQNRQAMFSLGSQGTPTVVFTDDNGNLQSRQGVPPDRWLSHYAQD